MSLIDSTISLPVIGEMASGEHRVASWGESNLHLAIAVGVDGEVGDCRGEQELRYLSWEIDCHIISFYHKSIEPSVSEVSIRQKYSPYLFHQKTQKNESPFWAVSIKPLAHSLLSERSEEKFFSGLPGWKDPSERIAFVWAVRSPSALSEPD